MSPLNKVRPIAMNSVTVCATTLPNATMSGMDIYTLSRILGRSGVTVTEQAYLDLTDEDLGKRYQHFSPLANMRNLHNKKAARNY